MDYGWRDQGGVLKAMIDDSFIPNTGIPVNPKVVQTDYMNAIIAGAGPDVLLTIGGTEPVNYASRSCRRFNAIWFEKYTKDFILVLMNNINSMAEYAIPETQSFDVMFYRTDILGELVLICLILGKIIGMCKLSNKII